MEAGRGRIRPSVQERLFNNRHSLEEGVKNIEKAENATKDFIAQKEILAYPIIAVGTLDKLARHVSALDINDGVKLKSLQFGIVHFCSSAHAMQTCIQHFHGLAMVDPVFGLRAAAALATVSNLIVEGVKLRNILITALQNDFSNSEEVRMQNKSLYLNMVGFLGQVFSRVKLNDEPIRVLSLPHLVYQRRLLEGDDTELELCVLLLAQNGVLLAECQATNSTILSEFFVEIMSHLLKEVCSQKARGWLMLAFYLNSHKYTLSPQYHTLFLNVLGFESMRRIVCALNAGATPLPVQILDEKSLSALRVGPAEEGAGDFAQV